MDDLLDQAMAEARTVAERLIEKRIRGMQRLVSVRETEIRRLRLQLAEYESQEETNQEHRRPAREIGWYPRPGSLVSRFALSRMMPSWGR